MEVNTEAKILSFIQPPLRAAEQGADLCHHGPQIKTEEPGAALTDASWLQFQKAHTLAKQSQNSTYARHAADMPSMLRLSGRVAQGQGVK